MYIIYIYIYMYNIFCIYNCFSFGQININKTKPFATQKDQPLHVVGVKF